MRKQSWIVIILLSMVLFQLFCTSLAASSSVYSVTDRWLSFRCDSSHSGSTTDNYTVNSVNLLWSFTTMDIVSSSASVDGGVVFAGSLDGGVYCLSSFNGSLVWLYSTRSRVESSPAVSDGCVFVGCDDGNVYALNASNGAVVWKYLTDGMVYSSPVVAGGVVFAGSYDGNVYSLNATTGAKLWSYYAGGNVFSSPAVVDGTVYVASSTFFVYALNASSGDEIWRSHTGSTVSSPSVNGGYVYVGSYLGDIYGLNASSGKQIWKYQTQGSVDSSPALAYGCIYVGSQDNNVYCLNASNGQRVWQSPTGYWVTSSPAVANGKVYVGSKDYNIYCFNASTGEKEWSYATGNFVDSSPAIANGDLYFGSDDHNVYAFALFNSTAEILPLQSNSSLAWSTIAFDVLAATAGIAIILTIMQITWSNKRANLNEASQNISRQSLKWFSLHIDTFSVLAILGFSIIFFLNLGSGHLWAADEQTYSQWAFHMVKNGDYLTPWSFGNTSFWIGKPPLNMWLMSLAYQVFGVNNFSARVWSAIFGTFSLVFVFYLGRRLYNSTVGFLSAIVLGSFTMFYSFATHAMTDGPFVCFMLASIYFFVLSQKTEKINKYAALSGLFFGLALMTKQFEALLIPLIIFSYLILTRRNIRFLFTKASALFWGISLLVFSPWIIYMSVLFGSDFLKGFFTFNVAMRIISPVEGHSGGYLFYFNYLINNENLLWLILLPFAVGLCAFNSITKRFKEDTLVLLWLFLVLLVFTFAQTKLYWYILPAFPAFALSIGNLLHQILWKAYSNIKYYSKTQLQLQSF